MEIMKCSYKAKAKGNYDKSKDEIKSILSVENSGN